jgi:hypothetical protein
MVTYTYAASKHRHARLHPAFSPHEGTPELSWDLTARTLDMPTLARNCRVPMIPDELDLPCSHPPVRSLRVCLAHTPFVRRTITAAAAAAGAEHGGRDGTGPDALTLDGLITGVDAWMRSNLSVDAWRALPKDVRDLTRASFARRAGAAVAFSETSGETPYTVADTLGHKPMFLSLEREGHTWILRTARKSACRQWR